MPQRLPHVVQLGDAHHAGVAVPASLARPRWWASRKALSSSSAMSASLAWVSWKPGDRLAELRPVHGVRDGRLQAVAGRAEDAPDDAEPGLGQAGQRALQAAHLGQHRVVRQPDALEDQLGGHRGPHRQLVLDQRRGEAGRVGRDDEAPDAVVGLGPHDGHVGDRPVGDPHLRAVEDPVRALAGAVAPGPGAHAARVGAVVGLGQAEAADRLAGRHPRQPLLLLRLRAEPVDGEHRERALHRHHRPDARVAGLDLQAGRRRTPWPPGPAQP